jgi:hypothetical protein
MLDSSEDTSAIIDPETQALWTQIEDIRQVFYREVRKACGAFWASNPSDHDLLDWLKENVWAEREGAKLHAYPVLKMAERLDPVEIRELLRQGADEAHHCELVAECLHQRGGDINGYEPKPHFRSIFNKCFQTADPCDPLHFYTLFYLSPFSEGAAVATAEGAVEGCKGTRNDDIARAYEKIVQDERRHWSYGMAMLRRHAKTKDEVKRALELLKQAGEEARDIVETIRLRMAESQ